ncbi:MAG TPA: SIR2 family protein [Terriglobia bacterium]|nr:SIR2 family protein [Terriglobia bacterium]
MGAGISNPPVPLASEIIDECKRLAPGLQEPPGLRPIDRYSFWLQKAKPSPADRQAFLRKLIGGKFVSQANLHLAHILLEKRIGNLVVTTNFDDFLSRGLTLFGGQCVVCDHPDTIQRITLATADVQDIQIVHVHGTYWFYDSCNLKGEIDIRAERSPSTAFSMGDFLDDALRDHSPLVVGYGGWEGDVFMEALSRRLKRQLRYNLYWFCYKRTDLENLPQYLRRHDNVLFVVPPAPEGTHEGTIQRPAESPKEHGTAGGLITQLLPLSEEGRTEPTLPATKVFRDLIEGFGLDEPILTKDPLGFLSNHLSMSFPPQKGGTHDQDIYVISNVIARIERAKKLLTKATEANELRLQEVFKAVRRSQYALAIHLAAGLSMKDLDQAHLQDLITSLWDSRHGLDDHPEEAIRCYDLVLDGSELLLASGTGNSAIYERIANALVDKGATLDQLGRHEEEIQVYDNVVTRFGEASEISLKERVAKAFVYKGIALGELDRHDEAIRAYDSVVARFGEAPELPLKEDVARALINKGVTLGQLDRHEEEIQIYDNVIARFGDASELSLKEALARGLFGKGAALGHLDRHEEEVQVYDTVVSRFGQTSELLLKERVAMALVNKGIALGRVNRRMEEIQVYDNVIARFGDASELSLKTQVANSLVNKGVALGKLDRHADAIDVYDVVVARFDGVSELPLKELVAKALINKGIALLQLGRRAESTQAYDALVARFGEASELSLKQEVAKALSNKGVTLGQLGRNAEAVQVYENIVARFGEASELPLKESVGSALNGIGFAYLIEGKKIWLDENPQGARDRWKEAHEKLTLALERSPQSQFVIGNLAYVEFLLGDEKSALDRLTLGISIGGEKFREVELADAEINSLPQDDVFRSLLLSTPLQKEEQS